MSHDCPYCYKDPLRNYDGDQLYEIGAYKVDEEAEITCSVCRKKIVMRPFASIDYDFELPEGVTP